MSFQDDSCQSKNGNETLTISTPLDGCKTSITQEDNQIIFQNKIKAKTDKYSANLYLILMAKAQNVPFWKQKLFMFDDK